MKTSYTVVFQSDGKLDDLAIAKVLQAGFNSTHSSAQIIEVTRTVSDEKTT